jgi:hypothetical protein
MVPFHESELKSERKPDGNSPLLGKVPSRVFTDSPGLGTSMFGERTLKKAHTHAIEPFARHSEPAIDKHSLRECGGMSCAML